VIFNTGGYAGGILQKRSHQLYDSLEEYEELITEPYSPKGKYPISNTFSLYPKNKYISQKQYKEYCLYIVSAQMNHTTTTTLVDNCSQGEYPPTQKWSAIKFRYTPYPELLDSLRTPEQIRHWCQQFIAGLYGLVCHTSSGWEIYQLTAGWETMDKYGEPTHPHIHIHFYTSMAVGSFRQAFTRSSDYVLGKEAGVTGNRLYSIKEEKDVLEGDRFFRYVLKQGGDWFCLGRNIRIPHNWNDIDGSTTYDEQKTLAVEEYQQMVERNRKLRDRKNAPNSCDRLLDYLSKLEPVPTGETAILSAMVQYYVQRGQPANLNTLTGYMNVYLIRTGQLTAEGLVSKHLAQVR